MRVLDEYGRPLWVIGKPLEHTLSPRLHNAAFEAVGAPHRYFALELDRDELPAFLRLFREAGGLGANLTLPLKETVLEFVDEHSDAVAAIGAANTLYRNDGGLALENTDVEGFEALVDPWSDRVSKRGVVLLGAGGAARACLYALGRMGCPRVHLWNRTHGKAVRLRDAFEGPTVAVLDDADLKEGAFDADLVVNATSLGLDPSDPSPFPAGAIEPGMVGVDLIYGRDTRFQRDFREHGEAVGGMTMLVEQAARAWELWMDREPDRDVMYDAVGGRS